MVTPHGLCPALMRVISFPLSTSTTETSSDGPLATYTLWPSGETAMPQGRFPTGIVLITSRVAGSTTSTEPPRPVVTKSFLPSLLMANPIGRQPVGRRAVLITLLLAA